MGIVSSRSWNEAKRRTIEGPSSTGISMSKRMRFVQGFNIHFGVLQRISTEVDRRAHAAPNVAGVVDEGIEGLPRDAPASESARRL